MGVGGRMAGGEEEGGSREWDGWGWSRCFTI